MSDIVNLESMYQLLRNTESEPFPEAFPSITLVCCWLDLEPLGNPDTGCWLGKGFGRTSTEVTKPFKTLLELETFCNKHLARFERYANKPLPDAREW